MLQNGGGVGWTSAPAVLEVDGGGGVTRDNCASPGTNNGTVSGPRRSGTFAGTMKARRRRSVPKKPFKPKELLIFSPSPRTLTGTRARTTTKKKKARVGPVGRGSAEKMVLRMEAHANSAKRRLETLSQTLPDFASGTETPRRGNGRKQTRRSSSRSIGSRIDQTKADLSIVATDLAMVAQEHPITEGGNVLEAEAPDTVPVDSALDETMLVEPAPMESTLKDATLSESSLLEPTSVESLESSTIESMQIPSTSTEAASTESTSTSMKKQRRGSRSRCPRIAQFSSHWNTKKRPTLARKERDEGRTTPEGDNVPETQSMDPTSMETTSKGKPRNRRRRRRPKLAVFSSKKFISKRPELSIKNFWKYLGSFKYKTIDLEAGEACAAEVIKGMEKLEKVTLTRYDSLKNVDLSGRLERKEWLMEDFENHILELQERIVEKNLALNIERGELRKGRRSSCCSFCASADPQKL